MVIRPGQEFGCVRVPCELKSADSRGLACLTHPTLGREGGIKGRVGWARSYVKWEAGAGAGAPHLSRQVLQSEALGMDPVGRQGLYLHMAQEVSDSPVSLIW